MESYLNSDLLNPESLEKCKLGLNLIKKKALDLTTSLENRVKDISSLNKDVRIFFEDFNVYNAKVFDGKINDKKLSGKIIGFGKLKDTKILSKSSITIDKVLLNNEIKFILNSNLNKVKPHIKEGIMK